MEEPNVQIVQEMFDAWNTRDVARYVKMLDAECSVLTHGIPGHVQGRDAAVDAMRRWLTAFTDLHFHVAAVVPIGERIVASWQATATPPVGVMRHPPAERVVKASGCTVIEFRHGRVGYVWSYWDNAEMLRACVSVLREDNANISVHRLPSAS